MKKVVLLIALFALLFPLSLLSADICSRICTYKGCKVALHQTENMYFIFVNCDDGFSGNYQGQGQFTGNTLCGADLPDCLPNTQQPN